MVKKRSVVAAIRSQDQEGKAMKSYFIKDMVTGAFGAYLIFCVLLVWGLAFCEALK